MVVLVSSRMLSKNTKIKIHRNITLRAVFYGCVTCSFILREGSRLSMFENG